MNVGECMEYAQKLCDATTAAERNQARAELRAVIEATIAAERERWHGLLSRALPMLREYFDYADSAPVWHCTGYEYNTLVKLIPEIEAALSPNV